jgi:5-methylcytosine-specific restriction endonuclease McrA
MANNHECLICGTRLVPSSWYCSDSCRERAKKERDRIAWFRWNSRSKALRADLTLEQWVQIQQHFKWSCAYCQQPYVGLDHFIPTALGGGTTMNNCFLAARGVMKSNWDIIPILSEQYHEKQLNAYEPT